MNKIEEVEREGFTIFENIYTYKEVEKLVSIIEKVTNNNSGKSTHIKSIAIFAIRQFLEEIPEALEIIFNKNLKEIIKTNFGENYFVTKSIYFDKPEKSNWFVAYHQDLTISVNKKVETINFENWTTKQNQYAIQPPKYILENNFTIRIHLDKTTKENGALKVVNKSHKKRISRIENLDINHKTESYCEVESGGIMIMKPLLFHASNKQQTTKEEE